MEGINGVKGMKWNGGNEMEHQDFYLKEEVKV